MTIIAITIIDYRYLSLSSRLSTIDKKLFDRSRPNPLGQIPLETSSGKGVA